MQFRITYNWLSDWLAECTFDNSIDSFYFSKHFFSFSPPSPVGGHIFHLRVNVSLRYREAQRNFRLDLWPCPLTMARANPRWNPVHSNRRLHSMGYRVYIRGATLLCRNFFHDTLMRIYVCVSAGPSSIVFFFRPHPPPPPLTPSAGFSSLDPIIRKDMFFFRVVHCIKCKF